jgi:hypothetical protein
VELAVEEMALQGTQLLQQLELQIRAQAEEAVHLLQLVAVAQEEL